MNLVTLTSAPTQNASDNSFVADVRIAHAACINAGGAVLSFSCLNELFATSE